MGGSCVPKSDLKPWEAFPVLILGATPLPLCFTAARAWKPGGSSAEWGCVSQVRLSSFMSWVTGQVTEACFTL